MLLATTTRSMRCTRRSARIWLDRPWRRWRRPRRRPRL